MREYLILFFSFVFPFCVLAQIEITGIVKNKLGEPIPGVTILVKGTITGTASDIHGNFRINIPKVGDTLIFSGIFFKSKEVITTDANYLEVFLKKRDLKTTVIPEFFYWGGLLNTSYGVASKIRIASSPPVSHAEIKYSVTLRIGYQTNLIDNQHYFLESSFFTNKLKSFNPSIKYRKIDFTNKFYFNSLYFYNGLDTGIPFIGYLRVSPMVGYSTLKSKELLENNLGIGLLTTKFFWIGIGYLHISISTLYWQDFWELKTSFEWDFGRGYSASIGYEKIQSFEEIQLSFGRWF